MIADRGYWQTTMRLRDLMDLLEIQKAGRVDWRALQATFAEIGYLSRAAGFLLAAELLLSPAFRAPDWAVSGRRWADRAVRGFFDPDFSRGRRAAAQLLADIEVIVQIRDASGSSSCRRDSSASWQLAVCRSSMAKLLRRTDPLRSGRSDGAWRPGGI